MKETPPSSCKAFEISGKLIDNLKIKRDLPSKLKFDCNSSLSSAGMKGSHEK